MSEKSMPRHTSRPAFNYLILLSVILVIAALWMIFTYAPVEATMGLVQKVFYFHVSSAWVGFFAFFITFVGSILYLYKRADRWDILAKSSAQIGFIFILITLISGMLWAKPVWGTFWVWEPRLTISLVQWLVYFSYALLRRSLGMSAGGKRITSVYGIVAFITVPLSWFAIRWWRTIHPEIISSSGSLPAKMLMTMLFTLLTFTVIYFTFLTQVMNIEGMEREKADLLSMEEEREG
jgi:heme exporter protein C